MKANESENSSTLTESNDDLLLIIACHNNEPDSYEAKEAWGKLWSNNYRKLETLLKNGSFGYKLFDEEIHDIINDTFERVFYHAQKYNQKNAFAWIVEIAKNTAKNYLRAKEKKDKLVYKDDIDSNYFASTESELNNTNSLKKAMLEAFDTLTYDEKAVLRETMRCSRLNTKSDIRNGSMAKMTSEEIEKIAAELGKSKDHIRVIRKRGLDKLRNILLKKLKV